MSTFVDAVVATAIYCWIMLVLLKVYSVEYEVIMKAVVKVTKVIRHARWK